MTRSVVGPILVLLSGWAITVQAEETTGEKAFKEYADSLVGGVWKSTVEATEMVDGKVTRTGRMVEVVHEYRFIAGDKFLRMSASSDGRRTAAVVLLGVDPATDKLTAWWFLPRMSFVATAALDEPGKWIWTSQGVNVEGKAVSSKSRFTTVGKDEILQESIEWIVDGEKQATLAPSQTWTRHPGTITADPPVDETDETETAAETEAERVFRSYAKHAVGGSWQAEGQSGSHQYRWIPGRRFVEIVVDDPTAGMGIFGIDPNTKQATMWWFIEAGLLTSTLRSEKEGAWIIEGSLPAEGEKTLVIKSRLVKIDDNKVRLEQIEAKMDGADQPLQPPTTYIRLK
jgi:hypothetical protein